MRSALRVAVTLVLCASVVLALPPGLHIPAHPAAIAAVERPQLVSQTGHTAIVSSVAISPDGRWVVSGSWDHSIKVWELGTGLLVRTLTGHAAEVGAVAISGDGRWLVSGSLDRTVKVWELGTDRQAAVRTLTGHTGRVNSVAVSPDGRWVVSGGGDGTVNLWELATGRLIRTLSGHTGPVQSVAVGPDGQWAVSGGGDGAIKISELATGRPVRTITHSGRINSVAVSPDGRWVVSGNADRTVDIWESSTGRLVHTLTGHARDVRSVAIGAGGRWVATGSADNTVKVWEIDTGREIRTLAGHAAPVESVAAGAGARWVVSGGDDVTIRVWDVESGRVIRTLAGQNAWVNSVAVSPDGRRAVSASFDHTIKVWELTTGRLVRTLAGHADAVTSVAVTAGGRQVVSGSFDGSIKVWDLAAAREIRTFGDRTGPVTNVAVTPDGQSVLSASTDNALKVWELGTGRLVQTLSGHGGWVSGIAVSTDGRLLVSGSFDHTIKVWNGATGGLIRTLSGHTGWVGAVAISPDGRRLVSGSADTTIKVWELGTGHLERTLTGNNDAIDSVAVSPDGRWVVSGGADGTVKVWELETGRLTRTLTGHAWRVESVAFSPDGHWVISGSWDGTTRVWNAGTGIEAAALVAGRSGSAWLVAAPDGLFDGSAEGAQSLVAWRWCGSRMYPPDKFFESYYTPGLLAQIWAGEQPRPSLPLAELKCPPEARIVDDAGRGLPPASTQDQSHVAVSVEVEDRGAGVGEVRLYQNGKEVGVQPGRPGLRATYRFDVDLVSGGNDFRAVALSRAVEAAPVPGANVRAGLTPVTVEGTESTAGVNHPAPPVKPVLYVMAAGIDAYKEPALSLQYARHDAESLVQFFQLPGAKKLFADVKVTLLLDGQATKGAIERALTQVAAQAKPEDVVVLYLGGHGQGVGQDFYFLPYETQLSGRTDAAISAAARQYGVPAEAVAASLRQIKAQKELVIVDACHAELALRALKRGPGPAETLAWRLLAHARGYSVIAASQAQEFAHAVPTLQHGVLTYAVLTGLGQAPIATEGIVTVSALSGYVSVQVPLLIEQYFGSDAKQYPEPWTAGNFPLWLR